MIKEIILLSDKSSGSTVFQYELLNHSEISPVDFTTHNDNETLFWLKAAVILKKPKTLFFENKYPFPRSYALNSLKNFIKRNTNLSDFKLHNENDIHHCWRALNVRKKTSIFFEKSPHHLNHLASVYMILDYANKFKDVFIIGLVRDPRSVINSTVNRWFTNPNIRQYKWLKSYENLIIFENLYVNENYIRLKYEDLVKAPETKLREIVLELGLKWEDTLGNLLHGKSEKKWKRDNFNFIFNYSVILLSDYFGYDLENQKNKIESQYRTKFVTRAYLFKIKSWLRKFFIYYIKRK